MSGILGTPWCVDTPLDQKMPRTVHRITCAVQADSMVVPMRSMADADETTVRAFVAKNGHLKLCGECLPERGAEPAAVEYEWAVEFDDPASVDGSGRTRWGYQHRTFEDDVTRWQTSDRNPIVFRRRIDRGPWEVAPDA